MDKPNEGPCLHADCACCRGWARKLQEVRAVQHTADDDAAIFRAGWKHGHRVGLGERPLSGGGDHA